MQIEKLMFSFYNTHTGGIEEKPMFRVSFKTLMVIEESLSYAIRKMFLYAHYKKLITLK